MATIQSGGSAVTSTSTNNDGGVIRRGGTIANNRWTSKAIGDTNTIGDTLPYDGSDAVKAISAGNFPHSVGGVAMKTTTTIAGQSNTTLRSAGAEKITRATVSKIESVGTRRVATSIRQGDWTAFSGTFSTAPSGATDSFGNDHAARPTRATPGEFVIKEQKLAPVMKDYPAKNG